MRRITTGLKLGSGNTNESPRHPYCGFKLVSGRSKRIVSTYLLTSFSKAIEAGTILPQTGFGSRKKLPWSTVHPW
jgi:hypothetical protein